MKQKEMIKLVCMECGEEKYLPEDSIYFKVSGLNYFCSGECEDRFSFKQ